MENLSVFDIIRDKTGIAFRVYDNLEEFEESGLYPYKAYVFDSQIRHLVMKKKIETLAGLPEFICELDNLTSLDISDTYLMELPSFIGDLSNLDSLDISGNNLTELPLFIGKLKNLTSLNVSDNKLTELPSFIGELRNLASLDIKWNELTELPSFIGELINLTSIRVGGINPTELPTTIASLKNLTSLGIYYSNLTELPSFIGELKNLKALEIYSFELTELPAFIGELENLTSLELICSSLRESPAFIGKLKNLTSLNIGCFRLTELPASIGNLKNLASLNLHVANLTELPSSISELKTLKSLDIIANKLTKLPSFIGDLSNLAHLNIYCNNVKELPASIGNLSNLTTLHISGDSLVRFPVFIGTLENLTSLQIRVSSSAELPAFVGGLKNLTELNVYGNNLIELPAFVGNLSNLNFLNISENNLTELPAFIGELKNLSYLDISNNNLKELPAFIGELKNLVSLGIGDNPIDELPTWLGGLHALLSLDLKNLTLHTIPKSVARLGLNFNFDKYGFDLGKINLYGVKLTGMDISLFEKPLSFIESFYDDDDGVDNLTEINECKIIFLGDGEVGKTSIIERIVYPEKEFNKKRPPTDGILITKYKRIIEGKDVMLRIWDFGGQEVMHTMHKCFLTSRTIYIVVLDARQNQFYNRTALYWLKTIEAFAPECPVLLVINKIDLAKDAAVNEVDLKDMYSNLQLPVIKTSAEKNTGIEELLNRIDKAVVKSDGYKRVFNRRWLHIKDKLENMTTPYIEKDDYIEICEEEHVTSSHIQEEMLDWFKDLGISYYYKGDKINFASEKIAVLEPTWLTGGIYRLITRTDENNGFVQRKTIQAIMEKIHPNDVSTSYTYRDREIDFVLNVMGQFEISHKYDDVEFVPLKLPKSTPEAAKQYDKENSLHLSWEAAYMPYNAIHRLMIKLFDEMDKNCVWLNGAKFNSLDGKKAALIYMDIDEKEIHAFVNSTELSERKEYLSGIRDKLLKILKQLNIKCNEYIHYSFDGKHGKVQYSAVLRQFYDGRDEIFLQDTEQYVNPKDLLHYAYTELDIGGAPSMRFRDVSGNVSINIGNNNETTQAANSTVTSVNHINWVERLPQEDNITSTQIKEFQEVIEAFIKSDMFKKMTNDETEPLKSALEESKNPLKGKSGKWKKLKGFFVSAAKKTPALITKIAQFIEKNPTVANWIKRLILGESDGI